MHELDQESRWAILGASGTGEFQEFGRGHARFGLPHGTQIIEPSGSRSMLWPPHSQRGRPGATVTVSGASPRVRARLAASACERSAYRTLRRRPSKENPHPQSQVRLGASSRESTHRLASRVAEACSHRVNLITGDTLNFGLTAAPASSTGARTDPERLRGPTKEPRNHYDCKSPLHQGRR